MDTVESPELLIVAAEPRELRGILRQCRGVKRLPWPMWFARSGRLNGSRLTMVANGPGPDLAAKAIRLALERSQPDAVISAGYCGALDPGLAAGEVFVAVRIEAGGSTYAGTIPQTDVPTLRTGTLASQDRMIGTVAEKARIRQSGAAAVDMEAGAVALEACRHKLPFYCIRVVLDRAVEGFELDFNLFRDTDGRFSRSRILKAALKRPVACVPELIKLERRGRLASRKLGEFLGTCAF
jgi:adenosylhomocysteine nucleosidase